MRQRSIFGVCGVLMLAAATARADEGRIPVYQPTSIQAPGYYVLTRDIDATANPVISIDSGDVVLDLNGRSISSPSNANELIVLGPNAGRVTIRNGRLLRGSITVHRSSGAAVGARVELRDLEMTDATWPVAMYDVDYVELASCRIATTNSGGHGVYLQAFGGTTYRGRFVGNTLRGFDDSGLLLAGLTNGQVRDNVIEGFGLGGATAYGIQVSGPGNLIEGNTVRGGGTNGTGIQVNGEGNRIFGNVVSDNDLNGLVVAGNSHVARNVATFNGDGIEVGGLRTTVEDNHVTGNTQCGLRFINAGNAYRDNTLLGNANGAVCGAAATDAGGNIQ